MAAQNRLHNYSAKRIFQSIRDDDIDIRTLLHDADIDVRDSRGNTLLLFACIWEKKYIFKQLLNSGANVNVFNKEECTVLHHASEQGWTKIVRSLVKKVPDLNARDICGNTAMHYAAKSGHLKVVQCLLEVGVDIERKNLVGDTPLLCAAKSKNYEVFDLLLRSRANVGSSNRLLLYYALRNQWHTTVLSLLKRVPYLHETLIDETIFDATSNKGHLEIVRFLVGGTTRNAMVSRAALYHASCMGQLEVVKWLVEERPDMKEPDFRSRYCWGETALYGASQRGYPEIVKYLLKERIDINARVYCIETVLHVASINGHQEVVRCLLEGGIDIDARDLYGKTALHGASKYGHLEVVTCLVEKGADTNVKSFNGSTSLLYAAEYGFEDIAALLIHSGANVNASYSNQCTTLHYATDHGWIEIVKSLINRGCDLDAIDCFGETALKLAFLEQRIDIAQTLLQAGASWDITDNDNSLFYRIIKEDEPDFEFIKLFIEHGAYFKPPDYVAILNSASLEVLQDVKLCSQAVVNKFNNHDLPELFKLPASKSLPDIDKMKIKSDSEVAQAIERTVRFEIQTIGHCNILDVHPIALCVFSVRSILGIV